MATVALFIARLSSWIRARTGASCARFPVGAGNARQDLGPSHRRELPSGSALSNPRPRAPKAGDLRLSARRSGQDVVGDFLSRCPPAPSSLVQRGCGDADVANLFEYLSMAARASNRRRKLALPTFGAENQGGARAFARTFFETLCQNRPVPSAIVFDDYHEARSEYWDEVIHEALRTLPEGISAFIISRADPPHFLVRHVAAGERDVRSLQLERAALSAARVREWTVRTLYREMKSGGAGGARSSARRGRLRRWGAAASAGAVVEGRRPAPPSMVRPFL